MHTHIWLEAFLGISFLASGDFKSDIRQNSYGIFCWIWYATPCKAPPPKTKGTIHSMWATYMLSMRSLTVTLFEMKSLQGTDHLTSGDPRWPLTSTKNNMVLCLTITHLHTIWNSSKLPTLRYGVNKVFRVCPKVTPNDLWPPPKTLRFFLLP